MAEFSDKNKHPSISFNKGNQYTTDDQMSIEALNNNIENSLYAVRVAENAQSATNNGVSYDLQSGKTEDEKQNARTNIGATSIAEVLTEVQNNENIFTNTQIIKNDLILHNVSSGDNELASGLNFTQTNLDNLGISYNENSLILIETISNITNSYNLSNIFKNFKNINIQDKSLTIGDTLIQWGIIEITGGSGVSTAQLPYPYADDNYVAITTSKFSEAGESFWWSFVTAKSTTTFTVWSGYHAINGSNGNKSDCQINWITIGKK